jgi:CxxC-x17-CxxC domain-containing protein
MLIEMEGEKFKAVCADCGKECEVPFKPTEGRPVKCNDCFRKGRPQRSSYGNNGNGRSSYGNNDRRGSYGNNNNDKRKDYDVTCSECGKATTVPFKPTQGKPVLCRDCYKKSRN